MKSPYTIRTYGVTIKQDEEVITRILRKFKDGSLDLEVSYKRPLKVWPVKVYLHFDSEKEAREEKWIK